MSSDHQAHNQPYSLGQPRREPALGRSTLSADVPFGVPHIPLLWSSWEV